MTLVTAAPEKVGISSARLGRITDWMQRYVEGGKLPCALTLMARHGEVVFLDMVGHMDLEAGKPVFEDTLFRFYSMTKPITSVGAMILYEEGCFQLDDPVSRFIPSFADMQVHVSGAGEAMVTEPARESITIRHLLTHSSGLTYGFGDSGPVAALYEERRTDFDLDHGSLGEVVERLCRIPLLFHPGERWGYGVSTDVLGRLIEVISGQTLDRFFEERILGPLGMVDTGFTVPRHKLDRFAALYGPTQDGGMELIEAPADSRFVDGVTTLSGGGGLISTIGDYFRFTEMLRRKGEFDGARLLSRKTVEYMTTNHLPGDLARMGQPTFSETRFSGVGFGLGFSVMLDPARMQVMGTPGEYAWGGMASTAFWIDPVEDITVIFLTQLSPSSTYPLRPELRVLSYQTLIA